MLISVQVADRVRTDPGKVWKVLEFNVEISKALKSLENDHRYGKI